MNQQCCPHTKYETYPILYWRRSTCRLTPGRRCCCGAVSWNNLAPPDVSGPDAETRRSDGEERSQQGKASFQRSWHSCLILMCPSIITRRSGIYAWPSWNGKCRGALAPGRGLIHSVVSVVTFQQLGKMNNRSSMPCIRLWSAHLIIRFVFRSRWHQ